ncbi:MAG: SDR family oxidoreductase [Alphaproteobacteria bacterium]|nr:SDR family oxidoreductase [Alphaproteobacteria bacterium]MCW5743896.1 SDR family oxidoreductase [Alphaproteobacteria bacterium]
MASRVLILGVTGFIGSALAQRLLAAGIAVRGVSRRKPPAPIEHVAMDLAAMTDAAAWSAHLQGVDAVINCAGLLQDAPGERVSHVQRDAPAALFDACEAAGVRRVIQVSAIGVGRADDTEFARTKHEADLDLRQRGLDWVILRPSVVIGDAAYGGSALLRGLAALPVVPVVKGMPPLQPVLLDDLLSVIERFIDPGTVARVTLDLAGPETWRFEELVAGFRRWMRWPPARVLPLGAGLGALLFRLGDAAALLGWRPAMRTTAGRELRRAALVEASAGLALRGPSAFFAARPASVQERWFARLFFVKPVLIAALAVFWFATGVICLGPGWRAGLAMMEAAGLAPTPAMLAVAGGALADMAVGIAIAFRRSARLGLCAALAVTLGYAALGTWLLPRLWADPMGALLKIIPIVALHLAALAIVEDR